MSTMKIGYHVALGFVLRLGLIAYGEYHDQTSAVKYTDVDYHVLVDAAKKVLKGGSPYERHTYRYTPVLAWVLQPSVWGHFVFGKVLFAAADVLVGFLAHVLVLMDTRSRWWAKLAAVLWLYNPLPMVVSTRGNAESMVATLVLGTLVLYRGKVYVLAGILYGLSIHFKIYPIIYSLPLYWSLSEATGWHALWKVSGAQFRLVLGTSSTIVLTSFLCYSWYGWDFVQEAYLYHITRKDIRHNFSIYFYFLYLTAEWDSVLLALIPFLPQAILLLAVAYFYHSPENLPFCLFCQTFVFVTFNKVCTSQYFLWYLSLLPVCLPSLHFTLLEGVILILIWYFAQGSWLLPAYYLEFEGRNTFLYIWLESIAFFCANIGILARLVRRYRVLKGTCSEWQQNHPGHQKVD